MASAAVYSTLVDLSNETSYTMSDRVDYIMSGWWDDNADQTFNDYVKGGPGWLVGVVAVYLLFVLKIGPMFMKNRDPIELPLTMKYYNLLNIVANVVLLVIGIRATNYGIDCFHCKTRVPFFFRYTLSFGYLYLKIFDLLDTVFFVLRKKSRQITTLHVLHHAHMPILTWLAIKFFPHPPPALTLLLNSTVHIVMYIYYYMAADPRYKQNLWWKKYITVLQLVQFLILLTQVLVLYELPCIQSPVHRFFLHVAIVQDLYFIYAFSKFYIDTYISTDKKIKST